MAIVNFNKKLFEQEIGTLDSNMQNRVAMFGTPVESVGGEEIQIEVFPNRPDLLSYSGFRRSFLAFLEKSVGLKEYKVNKPEKDYRVIIDSSVKDVRPYTACAIVRGLSLDDEKIKELIEIQEKLHITIGRKRKKMAIGIYPLEKIKLPITFKAIEPDKIKFMPLESDKELSGLEILHKHPAGKEYAHLLAGKVKFPIFIDANNEILSMPPIINSQTTGRVDSKTKDVFVECSVFDFEILKTCLNIITTTMAEMGGKIYQMEIKFGLTKQETTPDLKPKEMKLSLQNTNKLLGLNLNEKQLKQYIEKMGHSYAKGKVRIPAWRVDILHDVDLIEDVAISYGYENFIPEIPEISTIGSEDSEETAKRKISEIISGLGFIEDSEYPQKIFEIGRVFTSGNSEIKEKEFLSLAVSPGNFTEVKQILEYIFRMIDKKVDLKEALGAPEYFIEGRTAEIIFNKKKIGFIGEIHPKTLRNWKIKMPD